MSTFDPIGTQNEDFEREWGDFRAQVAMQDPAQRCTFLLVKMIVTPHAARRTATPGGLHREMPGAKLGWLAGIPTQLRETHAVSPDLVLWLPDLIIAVPMETNATDFLGDMFSDPESFRARIRDVALGFMVLPEYHQPRHWLVDGALRQGPELIETAEGFTTNVLPPGMAARTKEAPGEGPRGLQWVGTGVAEA